MKLDLINSEKDREIVMRKENKPKLLDLLRKFGNVVDYMTEPMVARFFGVEDSTINHYGTRNSEELRRYGYRVYRKSECEQILKSQLGFLEKVPNRGLRLYPIEAVVVIGMMLTESKVAEDLRNEIINELFGVVLVKKDSYMIEDPIERAKRWIEEQEEKIKLEEEARIAIEDSKKKEEEINRKQDIINSLVYNVSLAEKRQRINQIIKRGGDGIASRWNLLYREFNLVHHKNVVVCAKNRGMSVINYIDKHLNMINELYELTVKIFETDVENLMNEWRFTIGDGEED